MNFTTTWLFVIACYILNLYGIKNGQPNMDIIAVGIPAAFTELGIHTGFIIHKARVENLAKHNKLEDATVTID